MQTDYPVWIATQEQCDMSDKKHHKDHPKPAPDTDEVDDTGVSTQGFEGNNPDDSGPTSPPPPPPRKG